MTYSILTELSGSTLFPSRRWLDREDFHSLAEKAYLTILALRIIAAVSATENFGRHYVHTTIQASNFQSWRSNGTDLYVAIWALSQGAYEPQSGVPDYVPEQPFVRWLKALERDGSEVNETKRLFLRLDSMLHIHDSSMKAIRRIVQDWPHASHYDQQLATTRLLQMIRARMPRSELLRHLDHAAHARDLELDKVCNQETGDGCHVDTGHHGPTKKEKTPGTALGFLAGIAGIAAGYAASRALHREGVVETASSGSTSAASVATVVGGLGAGFDPNGDKGIYATKKPKRTAIMRRPPIA